MADREITWSLATQYKNGAHNGTFRFDLIEAAIEAAVSALGTPDPVAAQRWQGLASQYNIPIRF